MLEFKTWKVFQWNKSEIINGDKFVVAFKNLFIKLMFMLDEVEALGSTQSDQPWFVDGQ